ncbi:hypothetical protein [Bacillus sp. CGMCC 1.16541]|uniref:hypothetical protein n=1 Tax=Bacillus sp. CGMCC 1.16541 TaxID=2185143 RepID=UPI000D73E220|nr:hypothetical protein [Bacillus sp. CGMCC 1.16541]
MAFGINRTELKEWKQKVASGEIAFLTHYWIDDRFPGVNTVTKVGCVNVERLAKWGEKHGISARYIHHRARYPHFDLLGERQREILAKENLLHQLDRFES